MDLKELQYKANIMRQDVINMLLTAGSGHCAGPLGMADVFTALYFEILKHDPKNPDWEERDRLFLSNGHIVPVRYAAMARAGYFPVEELNNLRSMGSRLQGHPERKRLPGLESTSGPLGSGLAQAAGYAYCARADKRDFRIYCVCSDGEHDEGNHWEAVMFAGHYKLANLTVFVDRNNIQIDGFTSDVMDLEPLRAKYESFGWHVIEIDGHNLEEIVDGVNQAKAVQDKPTVIICHTVPGKGVSFMENRFEWHGKAPNKEEAEKALSELQNLNGKI